MHTDPLTHSAQTSFFFLFIKVTSDYDVYNSNAAEVSNTFQSDRLCASGAKRLLDLYTEPYIFNNGVDDMCDIGHQNKSTTTNQSTVNREQPKKVYMARKSTGHVNVPLTKRSKKTVNSRSKQNRNGSGVDGASVSGISGSTLAKNVTLRTRAAKRTASQQDSDFCMAGPSSNVLNDMNGSYQYFKLLS